MSRRKQTSRHSSGGVATEDYVLNDHIHGPQDADTSAGEESLELPGPAAEWFTFIRKTGGGHLALFSTYIFAIFIKWAVSLNGYSGQGIPPLHGDFEAQRHWLELTVNLPAKQWYRYDLQYWGLDYPLVTAYHSWILGKIARAVNPEWVRLDKSRGFESEDLKVFMRLTALATELFIFVPAVVFFVNRWVGRKNWIQKNVLVLLILLQPGLNIIDHGHFQYNSAMLGFTLWSIVLFMSGYYVMGSIMFVLALNFKQMALFYALPVFFFLLGRCFVEPKGFLLLIKIGISVIATFAVIFSIYLNSLDDIIQVFRRVFPVQRGLYEDKVANVWCSLSVVLKLREMFQLQHLIYLSIAATLLVVLPSCLNLLRYPTKKRLLYALINSSLGFFLFSFQVHEKSILLPVLPVTLLLLDEPIWSVWFNIVAMFSMWPLLKRDQLGFPYILLLVLWNWLTSFAWRKTPRRIAAVVLFSYLLMFGVHILEIIVPPPPRLPHIYIMANVGISTGLFFIFLLYFNHRQFRLRDTPVPVDPGKVKAT